MKDTLLPKTNLETVLRKTRDSQVKPDEWMLQVQDIFAQVDVKMSEAASSLQKESSTNANKFEFDLLETDRIFHLSHIKETCVDYRLRFLDMKYFKGDVPAEALLKISELEQAHQTKLAGFKIAAPSKLFELKKSDDPLLFVPIGNDYYYLVHKWGNDLHPLRKLMMYPFRNLGLFTVFMIFISLLITSVLPVNILGPTNPGIFYLISFLFTLKSVMGFAIYYSFWQGKNFNEYIWNSRYDK
jgi:hypothetical protein